jgi:hypothetical protein
MEVTIEIAVLWVVIPYSRDSQLRLIYSGPRQVTGLVR